MKYDYLFLFILSLSIGCTPQPQPSDTQPKSPNIILIMADDLGYGDLSSYGNTSIHTPNIDSLVYNGIKFTDFHSNGAVCSPTRAALMTGKYQQRSGIEGVVTAKDHRHTGLPLDAYSMADFFVAEGYKTGMVGKWHLGYDTLFSPINQGFQYFNGYVSGNIDYHSHIDQMGYYDWWENKDTIIEEGYSTDLITASAVKYISQNKENPFFLYVAHEAPHYPFQGRNDKADRTVGGDFKNLGSREDKKGAYKEMVEIMDEGIGDIIQELEDLDLLENTVIFFCSDNGAMSLGSNGGLRGFKGKLWEGGHRVPAAAYWKGNISPTTSAHSLMTMDIFSTMVDIVHPDALPELNLDGVSFKSLLLGEEKLSLNRPIFWKFKNHTAVRAGEWKLLREGEDTFLFNLKDDLGEQNNLVDTEMAMKDSLSNLLVAWDKEMLAYPQETK